MAKVYLSPAYHRFNPCAIDGCDETTHNNLYMDEVEKFLTACGIEWKRGPRRVPKSAEDGNVLMRQAVAEANEWGCDIYYVSHTNASTNLSDGVVVQPASAGMGCPPIPRHGLIYHAVVGVNEGVHAGAGVGGLVPVLQEYSRIGLSHPHAVEHQLFHRDPLRPLVVDVLCEKCFLNSQHFISPLCRLRSAASRSGAVPWRTSR